MVGNWKSTMAIVVAPRESAHVYKRGVLFLNTFMHRNNSEQKLLRTSNRVISPIKKALRLSQQIETFPASTRALVNLYFA